MATIVNTLIHGLTQQMVQARLDTADASQFYFGRLFPVKKVNGFIWRTLGNQLEKKNVAADLHENQLLRYFNVSKAKFGVLTNGITYRFYTDLAEPNKMDEKPFLEVNLLDLKDAQIEELKKFHKSYFDVNEILSSASELKYMGELRAVIGKEFASPTPDFVRYFGKQVYDGVFTPKVLEQFTGLVKRTIGNYINDTISERLKAAIKDNEENREKTEDEATEQTTDSKEKDDAKIITTEEELEAFYII